MPKFCRVFSQNRVDFLSAWSGPGSWIVPQTLQNSLFLRGLNSVIVLIQEEVFGVELTLVNKCAIRGGKLINSGPTLRPPINSIL